MINTDLLKNSRIYFNNTKLKDLALVAKKHSVIIDEDEHADDTSILLVAIMKKDGINVHLLENEKLNNFLIDSLNTLKKIGKTRKNIPIEISFTIF